MKMREQRREQAIARNTSWASMSPLEQLADLDRRLGKGVGAERQRAKLKAKLEKSAKEAQS